MSYKQTVLPKGLVRSTLTGPLATAGDQCTRRKPVVLGKDKLDGAFLHLSKGTLFGARTKP